MGVSKVVFGNDTLVDLTGDTVTPTSLTLGATAHGADGEPIVGEYQYVLPPMSSDVRGGARIQPDSGLEVTDTDNLQVRLALESDGTVRGGIAELQAKGHAEQRITTGKNLLPNTATRQTANGLTFTVNADGSITVNGTATVNITYFIYTLDGNKLALPVGSYVLSDGNEQSDSAQRHMFCSIYKDGAYKRQATSYGTKTFAIEDGELVACGIYVVNGTTIDATFYPMLRLASITDDTYEPYTGGAPSPSPSFPQEIQTVTGHTIAGKTGRYVDLVVKQGNTTLFTTPIPLPSRGWVAGLPDGTADSLLLDGAGKCEWELADDKANAEDLTWGLSTSQSYPFFYTVSLTNFIRRTSGRFDSKHPVYCTRYRDSDFKINETDFNWAANSADKTITIHQAVAENPAYIYIKDIDKSSVEDFLATLSDVEILYPLATPVVEDCGYVKDWPTDIPEGATLSIRELDSVGIKYFIDSSVTELAKQWYARAYAELGDAVTELAGRVAALENA